MSNYNKLILLGNMTRDIEIKTAPSGVVVANGGLAVNKKVKGENLVTFIDFKAFGKTAELLDKYIGKGDKVLLEGEIQLDRWETQNGDKRSKLVMYVNTATFMPKAQTAQVESATADIPDEEEVPF